MTNNQLEWVEKDGLFRAYANGFSYYIEESVPQIRLHFYKGEELMEICGETIFNHLEKAQAHCESHHQAILKACEEARKDERKKVSDEVRAEFEAITSKDHIEVCERCGEYVYDCKCPPSPQAGGENE